MLENSIWQQYHSDQTIRETLAGVYGCDAVQISSDEAELYAILKRHLTKKELRLFIMSEAGVESSKIIAELKLDEADFDKAKHKTYSKLKGNKIHKEIRLSPKRENEID